MMFADWQSRLLPAILGATPVACPVALSLLVGNVVAQEQPAARESGFYVGASLGDFSTDLEGATSADIDEALGFIVTVSSTRSEIDDSDTGWKLVGGYNINKYLGAEAFYADFGTIGQQLTAQMNGITGTVIADLGFDADFETTGVGATVVGKYPVTDSFSVIGKLGLFAYETTATLSLSLDGTVGGFPIAATEVFEDDDSDSGTTFGVGAAYGFENGIALRADWDRYQIDTFDGDLDADLFSISLLYSF